jgi:hypothetical protein
MHGRRLFRQPVVRGGPGWTPGPTTAAAIAALL